MELLKYLMCYYVNLKVLLTTIRAEIDKVQQTESLSRGQRERRIVWKKRQRDKRTETILQLTGAQLHLLLFYWVTHPTRFSLPCTNNISQALCVCVCICLASYVTCNLNKKKNLSSMFLFSQWDYSSEQDTYPFLIQAEKVSIHGF